MNSPYISIVIGARNDNYGGDFEARLQNCVNWFDHYAHLFQIKAEFIIVNYNPVPDRKPLSVAIRFSKKSATEYRIVTVPNSFHQGLSDETVRKKLTFYEYIVKNIGIRRASGRYILSANPDILPDPSILKCIAKQKLQPGNYYRTDRANYHWPPGQHCNPSDLKKIREAVDRVATKGVDLDADKRLPFYLKVLKYKLQSYDFRRYYAFYRRFPALAKKRDIYVPPEYMSHLLHTHASGDFLLMHRDKWFELHGHPENTYLPVHTDAITVAMAAFSGLKERIFFYPCYHQEHEKSWVGYDTDPAMLKMYEQFEQDGRQMEATGKPIIYNGVNWGFADEKFEVITI